MIGMVLRHWRVNKKGNQLLKENEVQEIRVLKKLGFLKGTLHLSRKVVYR